MVKGGNKGMSEEWSGVKGWKDVMVDKGIEIHFSYVITPVFHTGVHRMSNLLGR